MTKKKPKSPESHRADQSNANKGTSGTNIAYDKVHGNRGKQKDQNRKQGK